MNENSDLAIRNVDGNGDTIDTIDWSKWRRVRMEEAIDDDGKLVELISHCVLIPQNEIDYELKRPLTPQEKMLLLSQSIEEEPYPDSPPEAGYKYQRKYSVSAGKIVWVLIPDETE